MRKQITAILFMLAISLIFSACSQESGEKANPKLENSTLASDNGDESGENSVSENENSAYDESGENANPASDFEYLIEQDNITV